MLPRQYGALEEELLEAVSAVFAQGQLILGPEVEHLEEALAERLSVRRVVTVHSGTDALVLALKAHGLGEGDEILTVSHSFLATASAIVLAGATPVFVDVDDETMTMDPGRLEEALTERTRAVLPVHLNGFPCDREPIARLCEREGLTLIEDCAQAIGALGAGRPLGSEATGCFSLHPLKLLSAAGDGGFISTNDDALAERLRRLRNHGLQDRDHCLEVGLNSRLDTLQAAIVLTKLPHLDRWIEARRAHAAAYREALAGRLRLPPTEGPLDRAVYSAFVVRHERRDALVAALHRRGVDAKIHYPLAIHQQPPFRRFARHPLPVTERVVGEILSLPVAAEMSEELRAVAIAATLDALEELA